MIFIALALLAIFCLVDARDLERVAGMFGCFHPMENL
jgi:hypothetical protein